MQILGQQAHIDRFELKIDPIYFLNRFCGRRGLIYCYQTGPKLCVAEKKKLKPKKYLQKNCQNKDIK